MRRFLILLLFTSILTACNDKEDNKSTKYENNNAIVGVWKFKEKQILSGKDHNDIINTTAFSDCTKKSTIEFTKDGFMKAIFYLEEMEDGDGCEEIEYRDRYTYNPDKLEVVLGSDLDKDSCHVFKLDSTTLKIDFLYFDLYDDDGTEDYNKDGINDIDVVVLTK